MPSITTWNRLEPRARSSNIDRGLQARVHDPLWALARQWQFGEFQGHDGGSPIVSRLRGECSLLERYSPGNTGGSRPTSYNYNPKSLPLETLVEQESVNGEEVAVGGGMAAEAGLMFLRMLSSAGAGQYRQAFIDSYPLGQPEETDLDLQSARFVGLMASRVPNAAKLHQALNSSLHPSSGSAGLPSSPSIDNIDVAVVTAAAERWLEWYGSGVSQPGDEGESWAPERMEYQFTVSAKTSSGEAVFRAPEFSAGRLDWYSFDLTSGVSLGATGLGVEITQTTIPTPVSYPGMPSPRWWEFEDAQVDFGGIDAGPEDLARLLLTEFATVYGNDWYVIPVPLDVGSVCDLRSLVVTDTFGHRTLVPSTGSVDGSDSDWKMFRFDQGSSGSSSQRDLFMLAPALGSMLQSPPIEEVLLLRDEMANLAWAVERTVESYQGRPLNRFEQAQARVRELGAAPAPSANAEIAYRLSSNVPENWIPLVPVRSTSLGTFATPSRVNQRSVRFKRGTMLRTLRDGVEESTSAIGKILMPDPDEPLFIYEEEVPRSGARVTRSYQYTRWFGGATHLWIGRRKRPGRGEGSSGLRFDIAE